MKKDKVICRFEVVKCADGALIIKLIPMRKKK